MTFQIFYFIFRFWFDQFILRMNIWSIWIQRNFKSNDALLVRAIVYSHSDPLFIFRWKQIKALFYLSSYQIANVIYTVHTIPFKRLESYIWKDALNWSKVTVKTFIMLQKISISNKYICSFELSIHQRQFLQKIWSSTTVFNIDN